MSLRKRRRHYDFAGVVVSYDESTALAVIQQRNHFKPGQEIEFFGPHGTFFKQVVGEITDLKVILSMQLAIPCSIS